ncbi:PLP-dependent aminotransferase family protein [Polaromonas sp. UBA4122]|uniref:MocR-like pyridoxine biosynthesis transcription factor PdxR n=1 Tax=Polaromonas sp. UBA4122 TaxID=1947074 RepID=UPI0039C8F934
MKSICSDLLLQHMGTAGIAALGKPFNRGLYECIRGAIQDGSLAPSTRLPPSRDLAAELQLSRNTVMYAYEQLLAEGYVHARIGSGTFVASTAPEAYLNATQASGSGAARVTMPGLSPRGARLLRDAAASPVQWGAFMPGVPDVTRFPYRRYAQISARLWSKPDPALLSYSYDGGLPALRETVAVHLRLARSIRCAPEQVLITEGIHQAIDLVVRLLGSPGDVAWVEEPSYWGIRSILQISDIAMQPIAVDADGMSVPSVAAGTTPAPRFVFVTPSHQYPLGAVMSLARRRALLELARQTGAWIVEDDYDSEFRYSGQPIPSLQGLEPDAPVIYIGTFSKTLFPGLRMGYLVLPPALATLFQVGHAELYRGGHLLTQAAIAEFMRCGEYAAHIRRMRLLYGKRRAVLAGLITRFLGPHSLHEHASNAGLHLVLRLPDEADDQAISTACKARGILARPLSRYFIGPKVQQGLLLGYACVPEEEIGPAFAILLECIRKA